MELSEYRRPPDDTGIGFHYTAAAGQGADLELFRRWAAEMRAMHATWTTILNPSVAVTRQALAMGLEPVHRFYLERPGACPVEGEALHHQRLFIQEGGGRWVQDPHNEPNNLDENPVALGVADPADLAKVWVPWAKQIITWGGYPSTPALSPGGTVDDLRYLSRFLEAVNQIVPAEGGRHPIWDRGAWVAVHNYTLNHPPEWDRDRNGFLGYRRVAEVAFALIGREVPVLSTEGGPVVGAQEDRTLPAVDEATHAAWARWMAEHMRPGAEGAPRWYFGLSFWLIANYAAGFLNPAWESAAWFKPDRALPAVDLLRALEPPCRDALWAPAPDPAPEPAAEEPYAPFAATVVAAARGAGIEPALLAAVDDAESAWNAAAYREEPTLPPVEDWGDPPTKVADGSLGLAQILRSTARGFGIDGDAALYDVANNQRVAAAILAGNLAHFQGDERRAISAYNQGVAGCEDRGPDFNRGYVDHVLALRERYRTVPALQATERFFAETGYAVGGAFLRFFEEHGLDVCGYPVSEVTEMHGLPSQLFQRLILEEYEPGKVRPKLTTDLWKAAEEKLARIREIV